MPRLGSPVRVRFPALETQKARQAHRPAGLSLFGGWSPEREPAPDAVHRSACSAHRDLSGGAERCERGAIHVPEAERVAAAHHDGQAFASGERDATTTCRGQPALGSVAEAVRFVRVDEVSEAAVDERSRGGLRVTERRAHEGVDPVQVGFVSVGVVVVHAEEATATDGQSAAAHRGHDAAVEHEARTGAVAVTEVGIVADRHRGSRSDECPGLGGQVGGGQGEGQRHRDRSRNETLHGDRHAVIGVALGRNSVEEGFDQIREAMAKGADGINIWSWGAFSRDDMDMDEYIHRFSTELFPTRVDVPERPWKSNPTYGAVIGQVTVGKKGEWADGMLVTLDGTETTLADGTGFYAFFRLLPGEHVIEIDEKVHRVNVEAGKATRLNVTVKSPGGGGFLGLGKLF